MRVSLLGRLGHARRYFYSSPTPLSPKEPLTTVSSSFFSSSRAERWPETDGFNRWAAVPAVVMVQLGIGAVYAWSIFNEPLTRNLGVVASHANDWSMASVLPVFSLCAVSLGVVAAVGGPMAAKFGPRAVCSAAAVLFAGGLGLTSFGVSINSLPTVYAGYGLLCGAGWGLGYMSPIPALLMWFPDRRGVIAGMAVGAFGVGAAMAAQAETFLISRFFRAPEFVGSLDTVRTIMREGRSYLEDGREVILASASDVARLPVSTVEPGVYLLESGGSTGAAATFGTLACVYGVVMAAGALLIRIPKRAYSPPGFVASATSSASVPYKDAMRTPQFYLLWTVLCGNCVAGVTIISTAKTMVADVFSSSAIMTASLAGAFVVGISLSNVGGRLLWGSVSDRLGRKLTVALFGLSVPLVASIPYICAMPMSAESALPLWLFWGVTHVVVSFYGAVFAVLPAYIADLFGQGPSTSVLFGRMITALPVAALIGPSLLAVLRNRSIREELQKLMETHAVDAAAFEARFGAPLTQWRELAEQNVLTIPRLMELLPVGTFDPSALVYSTTMLSMSGILGVAFVANLFIRPVSRSLFKPH